MEMEFYLPINRPLDPLALDALTRRYDPLSAGCPTLDFRQVRGMLKGFIDLVFRHDGRYYLLDYKSSGFLKFIVCRGGADINFLSCDIFKFIESKRSVVRSSREAESVFDQY